MRDYRFDVARVVCMTYIVAFMHLYAYVYPEGRDTYYISACVAFVDACLGLFTLFLAICWARSIYLGSKEIVVCGFSIKNVFCELYLFISCLY